MRYTTFDIMQRSGFAASQLLDLTRDLVTHPFNPFAPMLFGRLASLSLESTSRALRPYPKPDFDLDAIEVDERRVPVSQEVVRREPFCNLLRFRRHDAEGLPKVLVLAALSGHYATLMRDTILTFLPDHEVYVTDWQDAREVPLAEGSFGYDDYVSYVIDFLGTVGPGTHLLAVCQPCVQALTATAVLAARGSSATPPTLTLMAGPIDTRINPGQVNRIAEQMGSSFYRMLIVRVPSGHPGAGRRVYPGQTQLASFVAMNLGRHLGRVAQFWRDELGGRPEEADKYREFYDEYRAVLDVTEEFYLETVDRVFLEHHIPRGVAAYRGEPVRFDAIRDTALLTIEGEKDDTCPPGQTQPAHDVCSEIPATRRDHFVQPGVGHYGIFSGSVFRRDVAPRVKAFMTEHSLNQH